MEKTKRKLRIGLPQGSLNNPKRCDLVGLLKKAGYEISGYEPENKSTLALAIENDDELEPVLCRPQNAPQELARGDYDIAIIGNDWVSEWKFSGNELELLYDLGIGKTRLVIGVSNDRELEAIDDLIPDQGSLRVYSEYPNITRALIRSIPKYQKIYGDTIPVVNSGGRIDGDNRDVEIIQSFGGTEWSIPRGSSDFIVECVQNGNGIKENGIKDVGEILTSTAGLYCSLEIYKDSWKLEKALEVRGALRNAVNGEFTGPDWVLKRNKELEDIKLKPWIGNGRTKTTICAEICDQFGFQAMLNFCDYQTLPAGYE
tara:strand:- start:9656 stop:10600 length:945 start_codon:yes stop_codon:yes gene_type:complete